MEIPEKSEDLIRLLDLVYPTPTVNPLLTMEEIMYNAGRRAVVESLLESLAVSYDDDEEGDLDEE
jgi:ribosome assembly protein YihI (activator of Der GTPase)